MIDLVAKLVKDKLYKAALLVYTQHHSASIPPTKFTLPYILKSCAELKSICHGEMLHAHILKTGHLDRSKHTRTDLVNMYMKLDLVKSAANLFDGIPHPDLSVLNVMISGYSQSGLPMEAFKVFKAFSVPGLHVDEFTIGGVVSKCGNAVNGGQVHCLVLKIGLEGNGYVASSLMTMYLRCGGLGSATRLLGLIEKNLVCYNAYFSGVAKNGIGAADVVYCVFNEMRALLSEKPDEVTMISVLSACVSSNCLRFGRQLHGLVVKLMLQFHTHVGSSLVDMYSKCGSWQCAYSVFRELGSNRNLVTWNSIIGGMMLNGQDETAIELFDQLETHGLKADSVTWNSIIGGFSQLKRVDKSFLYFRKMQASGTVPNGRCLTCLLAACSDQSMLQSGKQLHAYARRMGTIDEFLAASIIDMYMNCGVTSYAQTFFDHSLINSKDAVVWNTMISGYGRNGKSEDAFDIFDQMRERNVKPTLTTFNCLFSVCNNTGQVDKAFQIFRLMSVDYGFYPTSRHTYTMINLLSKSGKLDEACELLQSTNEASVSVFASLLGAYKDSSDCNLAEDIAEGPAKLDTENPIPFVILSNIYAGLEKWNDVHKIRKLMDQKGIRKFPAISYSEVTG